MSTKNCVVCGEEFTPASNRQKYCSKCTRWGGVSKCEYCGVEFIRKPNTSGRFCSRQCSYAHRTMPEMRKRLCPVCGKEFKPLRENQNFCSQKCFRQQREVIRLRICPVCGKEFDYGNHLHKLTCSKECAGIQRRKGPMTSRCERCGVEIIRTNDRFRRFCSKECRGFQVGSKKPSLVGYVYVKVLAGTPGANNRGWILEHRHVMQQVLGRPLESYERIHHKNGDRTDNRPENLELWTVQRKDPAGQRQIDRVKEAITKLTQIEKQELYDWLRSQL